MKNKLFHCRGKIAVGLCVLIACSLFYTFSYALSDEEEFNRGTAFSNEAKERFNHSNFRGAIEKWEAALAIFQKLGKRDAIGNVLRKLGNAYHSLSDYRKAISFYEKALAIAEEIGDKEGKGRNLGNLGTAYGDLGDYRKAIAYNEKALAIAEEIGDKEGKGRNLGNLGTAYYFLGDYRKTIDYYEKALAIAEDIGDKQRKGTVLGNLAGVYSILGDNRKAIDYVEKALAIAEEIGDKQGKGRNLGNLGSVYIGLGDYRKAIDYIEKALAIAEEIGDKENRAKWLGKHGDIYYFLGDYRKVIDYYEKALAITEEIGDKQGKLIYLGNLGLAYSDLGDYRKAIDYLEKALAITEEIGAKQLKGDALGLLGTVYSGLGDYRKVIDYNEKALAIAEEIGDKNGKGVRLGNLGLVYRNLGDYRKAIDYIEKSLAIAEEIGDKKGKGTTLGNLGTAYKDLGDYRKAIDYHEKAIAILKEIGVPYGISEGNIGDAYLALDRDDEAFKIFTELDNPVSLGLYYIKKKNFIKAKEQFGRGREEVEEAKIASYILSRWIGLGLSYEGLKNYEEAYKWYTKAIAFMEEQRAGLTSSEREHYFEGKELGIPRIETYEGAVRCAFMLGRFDEAFYWAENTRGRLLSELLSKRHSGENYKIPAGLAKEEEDLTDKIRQNKKQQQTAFEKNNPELLKQLEAEYPPLKTKMERLIDRLRREYPQYASIKYPQPAKLSQLNLKKGETIIEYEVTGPYTIGFVIRDGRVVKAFKVDKTRTELASMITKYRAPFQEGADINSFNVNLGADLTALLLKPALSEINRGERLIIVSDESLSLLPFESLVLSMPSAKSKDHIYAIDEYSISYYQSASVLSLQRGLHITRAKEKSFFGLGDPVYGKNDLRISSLRGVKIISKQTQDITDSKATKDAGYKFDRLVNTEKEIKEVGKLFGSSKLLIGSDASEAKLKAEDLRTRRYVLFSTHGILGNEIPYIKQPALVLNLIGNDKEDGFLTASEIFNMDLNADIVGLSACKTGLGVQSAGEGVVGLSRAFMYAGTDTVLVSLWSVADESTYKLMAKFFDGLKNGKDKLTALKEAKNYLRNNGYDNPFYWAPFILVGEVN